MGSRPLVHRQSGIRSDKTEAAPRELSRIAYVSAIEKAVRADPALAVDHEVWDRDPWFTAKAGSDRTRPRQRPVSCRGSPMSPPSRRRCAPIPLWRWTTRYGIATLGSPPKRDPIGQDRGSAP